MMALTLGLVILTIAFLGGHSTALTIPEVISTLSLHWQQNDGAHAEPGPADHCSPWRSLYSSNYSWGNNHPFTPDTAEWWHSRWAW
jgi:hypothetical protein